MNKTRRIKELTNILSEASQAYYQEDREIMSDKEFDKLLDELQTLEEETGIRMSNSPTQKVGSEVVSALKKVRHEEKLLSLNKTKNINDLRSLLKDQDGVFSIKLDGLTISLVYENGKLTQALTRGDGETGEDVLHNAKRFRNIPLEVSCKEKFTVRGEAVISYADFLKINGLLPPEEQYKNPRNLVSGSVRQLNSEIAASRNIHFYAFQLSMPGKHFNRKSEQLPWIESQGFETADYFIVDRDNVEETAQWLLNKARNYKAATDGLVLTIDNIGHAKSLGATSKFPKDSLAFKWEDESVETRLVAIEWQPGRMGNITPVAVFEPVELEGTTVSRASLHNVSILEGLKLGIGDTISVFKANMIIPQVEKNHTRSNTYQIPSHCPSCSGGVTVKKPHESKILVCTNTSCPARLLQSLSHFVGREALNIEGLSYSSLEKFVNAGIVSSPADIFKIEQHKDKIMSFPGFGERSYHRLVQNTQKAQKVSLHSLIYALGIDYIGRSASKELCRHFQNDIDAIINADAGSLLNVPGFGSKMAQSVSDYFRNPRNKALVEELLSILEIQEDKTSASRVSGKIFVITGSLEHFQNRDEMERFIESLGGKLAKSVTSKTDFLITNDPSSGSSKNRKAREMRVSVITERDFLSMTGS